MSQPPATQQDARLEPVPHRVVASWPVGTFIENIAVLADGSFALSVHNQRQLLPVRQCPSGWRDDMTSDFRMLMLSKWCVPRAWLLRLAVQLTMSASTPGRVGG